MQTDLTPQKDCVSTSERQHLPDPFSDDDTTPVSTVSRESIRSFWICVSGLAIIAHLAIYLELLLIRTTENWLWKQYIAPPRTHWFFEIQSALRIYATQDLIPCLVLATVSPILYWRGGLAQRFAIALAIVVATMNSSVYGMWWYHTNHNPILPALGICGCWAMFPILFLFTPIRTERLRLVVTLCMLVLTVCVSFINMTDLRPSSDFLNWQNLFGAAFGYALLRRNWGNVAMLESSASEEHIEKTSTRTMLELMAVCGLASASYMYFSRSIYQEAALHYLRTAFLGVVSILVCMSSFKMFWAWKIRYIPWMLFIWFALSIAIEANSFMNFQFTRSFNSWTNILTSSKVQIELAFAGLSSLCLLIYLKIIQVWLRRCGWRMVD